MLLGATLFALVIGAAVSAPHSNHQQRHQARQGSSRHQMGSNPLFQRQNIGLYESVKQGFVCDWCVVGIEDGQAAVGGNLNQIGYILNRTSQLCEFCPVQDQCASFFQNDIPAAIDDFLAMNPEEVCGDAGLCDMNATLPGMVMNNLNSGVARDRVIKNMLKRARMVQQQLIRNILGPDFLCETCQDFVSTTRDILSNNETQKEVMNFVDSLCDYLPTEYQTDCDDFVQSLPELMTLLAKDVLLDSTCAELGFCKERTTEEPNVGLNLFGINLNRDLGLGTGQSRNPFQIPELPNVEIPRLGRRPNVEIPGLGKNPFGSPDNFNPFGNSRQRPEQDRSDYGQGRPGYGQTQTGRGRPGYGQTQSEWDRPGYGQTQPGWDRPWYGQTQTGRGRPHQSAPNTKPRPQRRKPKPRPETPKEHQIPDINLQDLFGKTDILDQLPDMQQLPNVRLPGLRINIPGFERIRRAVPENLKDRVQDILPGLSLPEFVIPEDRVHHEYIPDPIPDAGIVVEMATGDCDVCKMTVTAVDNWLEDNAAQLQKMVSQFILPFCTVFPSPMKEDCVSDVSDFVQNFIQILVSKLQPDQICTWIDQCDATAGPAAPHVSTDEPTTWPLMP